MRHLTKNSKLLIAISLTVFLGILIWLLPIGDDVVKGKHDLIDEEKQINAITIESEQAFTIEKNNQDWVVLDRLEQTNQSAVEHGIDILQQWVGESVDVNQENAGLDLPFLGIQIDYDDDTHNHLMIGHLDSVGENFYIEDREQEQVYLVERSLVEAFPFYIQAYLDTNLLPWPANEIENIFIDNGTEEIYLTKNSPYPEEETRTNMTGWLIEEPYHHYYHTTYSIMEELLRSMQSFQMTELIAENVSDWSEYGLDSSEFTIEFVTADDQIKFLMGSPATTQSYFARIDGEDQVFTLSNQLLNAFSYPAAHYHDGYVKILALDVMNQLRIESDQLSIDVEINHLNEDTTEFKVDDQLLDESEWRDAYRKLAGLKASGTSERAVNQEAEIAITSTIVHDQGEKEIVLELIDYSEDHYAASIDEVSDFLVDKTDVEDAMSSIINVLE